MIDEKRWTKEMEIQIAEEWKGLDQTFDPKSDKPVFSIDTPPPYPSGKWHIGAVAGYSLIDMIARSQRILGKNVLFPWGTDRNGINIELVVEKKYGKTLHEWDREEFIELCRKEIDPITKDLERIARRIGMSCDFSNTYYTDSDEYRAASQSAFIEMWNNGNITEDLRPNSYCSDCETTIADAEVYYDEKNTVLVHVAWKTEAGDSVVIATTRPELICACQVVLVHPEDERYKHLHGKRIHVPLSDRTVEIVPHPHVDPEYGSGVMMVSSYGDFGDVQLFRELKLNPIDAIGPDSKMTDRAGVCEGLSVKDAREKTIEELRSEGLIEKEEKIRHKFPVCERSNTPIEIINMKEWYVKQTDFIDDLKKKASEMKFYPEKHRQLLLNWMDSITIDWPISRRRFYHTEIPLWYCKECSHPQVPEPGPYYRPWKDSPPFAECEKCGAGEFVGEEKVFDTWMDSSISNLYISGYPDLNEEIFPVSIRTQGRDIVRTWLYYTTLKSYLLKGTVPFSNVMIHGMGLDEHGRKMSKSKGNVVDPDAIMEKYGADAFRLWAASETNIGDDFRISEERIEGAYKTLVKLWNISRFISQWECPKEMPNLRKIDECVISELNDLISYTRESYEKFDMHNPAVKIRHFVWESFASHYMEMVKGRAYNDKGIFTEEDQNAAAWTLNYVLDSVLKLLSPVCPFITYKLFKELRGGDMTSEEFPPVIETSEMAFSMGDLTEFNSLIWKIKRDAGKSLRDEIDSAELPESLKPIEKDLKAAHNIKNVRYG